MDFRQEGTGFKAACLFPRGADSQNRLTGAMVDGHAGHTHFAAPLRLQASGVMNVRTSIALCTQEVRKVSWMMTLSKCDVERPFQRPGAKVETADVPSPDSLAHPHGLSPLSLQGVMPVPDNNYAHIFRPAHIVDSPYSHVSACSLA